LLLVSVLIYSSNDFGDIGTHGFYSSEYEKLNTMNVTNVYTKATKNAIFVDKKLNASITIVSKYIENSNGSIVAT